MKKRVLVLVIALAVLVALGAMTAYADSANYCEHCKKSVQWKPLSNSINSKNVLVAGHYYADSQQLSSVTISASARVCLDLRGMQVQAEYGRLFDVSKGATLSIQDSVGGGSLAGAGYVNKTQNGGTVSVDTGAALNLYSGTLTNALKPDHTIYNGGVVFVKGAFDIYGGAVENGVCSKGGGNIYVNEGGRLGVHGGRITGGTATLGHTACGLVKGTLTLSGAPEIEKLRLLPVGELGDSITVSGRFTGKVALYVDGAVQGQDIGNVTNGGSFAPETIDLLAQLCMPYVSGTDILVGIKAAAVYGSNGFETYTDTVADAIALCQGTDKTLVLTWENNEINTVSQNINIDLKGFQWNELTAEPGATVYLKDSATDTYKDRHGAIAAFSGTVKAQPGYHLYTEETSVSAHAYSLSVTEAALRPNTAGMYFIGRFKGDSRLKSTVYSYGIMLDVFNPPSKKTFGKTTVHTSIREGFEDNNGVTSIPLTGVLKTANSRFVNQQNADLTVYCRPYIRFTDNTYDFGEIREISFRELVEQIDKKWETECVPTDLQDLYLRFQTAMEGWNVPNLKRAVQTAASSPYRVPTPMTTEKINSLPIATADMTPAEMRQLCADFFRMQLTFQWVSESDMGYDVRGRHVLLPAGKVYAGSPYSARSKSGNLYMTMEFYDEKTGVLKKPLDMTDHDFIWLFGNHCTYGPFWGWQRVINSITTQWNVNMGLEKYGYLPLGDFSTEGIEKWEVGVNDTQMIKESLGKQTVYEGYAQLQLADSLYTWYGDADSHMLMAAGEPVVVRNEDGTINGEESYILYMDQGGTWRLRNVGGDMVTVQGGLDDKTTFAALYNGHYLPFTYKEFHGLDPVEPGEVTSSLDGLTAVTPKQLTDATVKANYAISHVTVSVTDGSREVYRQNAFSPRINTLEMGISDAVDTEKLAELKGKEITVTCRIGTGEVMVLLDGSIA
jgi:hypothetical protein